ncbi:hypothetical protein CYLTODRAFT_236880 [Cylindrobasidium torrendii FP15055 ss-10]|uniref:Uncharacterized protein n=1 Tax=Cylindrobasidium torrendii FP15055 ss-10 TaxID=1314674 RepID=A0A0D7BG13_9AGAR|nr:hypothetical protein CYLTODRAFT_236880 [Cylindrobasidium torrendii FP15055 ss-10]
MGRLKGLYMPFIPTPSCSFSHPTHPIPAAANKLEMGQIRTSRVRKQAEARHPMVLRPRSKKEGQEAEAEADVVSNEPAGVTSHDERDEEELRRSQPPADSSSSLRRVHNRPPPPSSPTPGGPMRSGTSKHSVRHSPYPQERQTTSQGIQTGPSLSYIADPVPITPDSAPYPRRRQSSNNLQRLEVAAQHSLERTQRAVDSLRRTPSFTGSSSGRITPQPDTPNEGPSVEHDLPRTPAQAMMKRALLVPAAPRKPHVRRIFSLPQPGSGAVQASYGSLSDFSDAEDLQQLDVDQAFDGLPLVTPSDALSREPSTSSAGAPSSPIRHTPGGSVFHLRPAAVILPGAHAQRLPVSQDLNLFTIAPAPALQQPLNTIEEVDEDVVQERSRSRSWDHMSEHPYLATDEPSNGILPALTMPLPVQAGGTVALGSRQVSLSPTPSEAYVAEYLLSTTGVRVEAPVEEAPVISRYDPSEQYQPFPLNYPRSRTLRYAPTEILHPSN